MQLTTTSEIWWDFNDEDPNGHWCMAHATFTHRDACKFVLHISSDEYWQRQTSDMRVGGCTAEFIAAYLVAKDSGAVRVIFYC